MPEISAENKSICSRWVRQCVEIYDHPVLDSGPYDRRSAWGWLIANAAWKDRTINHKGKPLELKRGELLGARSFLAEKWGWTEQSVRTFMSLLIKNDMIKINQSGGHYANVITICNYDVYQTPEKTDSKTTNQSLTSVQPEPNQTLTKNTNTTNTNTQSSISVAARENEPAGWDVCKQAFNGSTEAMLADIQRFMGPTSTRAHAVKWLTGTLTAFGQQRTAQAWTIVTSKAGSGEIVANALPLWAKTAAGLTPAKATASAKPFRPSRW